MNARVFLFILMMQIDSWLVLLFFAFLFGHIVQFFKTLFQKCESIYSYDKENYAKDESSNT